jgi:hypothetical protein
MTLVAARTAFSSASSSNSVADGAVPDTVLQAYPTRAGRSEGLILDVRSTTKAGGGDGAGEQVRLHPVGSGVGG